MLEELPVHIVLAGTDDDKNRRLLADALAKLDGRDVTTTLRLGKAEKVIAQAVGATPGALLTMGAYGRSPLRSLIVGSTTTAMVGDGYRCRASFLATVAKLATHHLDAPPPLFSQRRWRVELPLYCRQTRPPR